MPKTGKATNRGYVNPAALPLVHCYSIRPPWRVASWVNYCSRQTESSSEHFANDLSLLKACTPWCENKRCSDSNPWPMDRKVSVLPTTPQRSTYGTSTDLVVVNQAWLHQPVKYLDINWILVLKYSMLLAYGSYWRCASYKSSVCNRPCVDLLAINAINLAYSILL